MIINAILVIAMVTGFFIAAACSFAYHVMLGIGLAYASAVLLIDQNTDYIKNE